MNGDRESVGALAEALATDLPDLETRIVLFPSYIFLDSVLNLLAAKGVQEKLLVGAQNCDWHESGAYTGEISAPMLAESGCRYVLAGHSERRTLYGETSEIVARKFAAIQAAGIIPVLCIGETLEERDGGITRKVIGSQLDAILSLKEGIRHFENSLVAYEPVWAIGTGKTATPEQAEEIHCFVREKLAEEDSNIAAKLPLLYGGSVNAKNAGDLFAMENIDGALVGGASLRASEFLEICRLAG